MKLITLINKLFGTNKVNDMMDTLDDESIEIMYVSIDKEDDACEPSYFIRLYENGVYQLSDISSKVLFTTSDEKELKKYLKVLAQEVLK